MRIVLDANALNTFQGIPIVASRRFVEIAS
jgi:hypothetical protein